MRVTVTVLEVTVVPLTVMVTTTLSVAGKVVIAGDSVPTVIGIPF